MENEHKPVQATTPIVTRQRFSEMTGLSEDTLRGMIERGHIPTLKVGKHRLINLALLNQECLQMDFDRF